MKVQVLNANEIEREPEIVALAGKEGQITVATNMAGRGTDIKLDRQVEGMGACSWFVRNCTMRQELTAN